MDEKLIRSIGTKRPCREKCTPPGKKPKLNKNQQIVLEWLKEAYKRTKWSSPFGTVYSTINIHEMFVRMRLTKVQQFQVLAAFAEWGILTEEGEG